MTIGAPGRDYAGQNARQKLRFVPLAAGALSLLTGLWTGLGRIGIALPDAGASLAEFHGALMISGFLGTLISLERAVAYGRPWAYFAPALSALGAAALLLGETRLAMIGFLLASGFLTAVSLRILARHFALFTFVLCLGAANWGVGTFVSLMDRPMSDSVGWWLNFLVLTIAAERLELSRLVSPPRIAQAVFGACMALLLAGAALGEFGSANAYLTGAGMTATAIWLLQYDIARRTMRQRGQTRFSAICMIAGHFWLAACGLLLLISPPSAVAFSYDAAIHSVTIGFALSMVFGHAPIILPAVTGMRVGFSGIAYGPLALLHLSLVMRIVGDLSERLDLRAASGIITVIALVTYAATLVLASRKTAVQSK